MEKHSKLCPKTDGYTDCHCSRPMKDCECNCHKDSFLRMFSKMKKGLKHHTVCCKDMNTEEKCGCKIRYCKHYKSDFDKFVEANP